MTVTLNPAIDRVVEVSGLVPGAHQPSRTVSRMPAGKGVNVSRVLAAMGVASTAAGLLGADSVTDYAPLFADGRIRNAFLVIPGRTRENITLTDVVTGLDTHLRDAGLAVDDGDTEALTQRLADLVSPGSVVVFSGSLPPGMTPEALAGIIERVAGQGADIVLDTSGPALRAVRSDKLWLVKPNAIELAETAGRELPTRDDQLAAAGDLAGHIPLVLFSVGAEGAYLVTRRHTHYAPAPVVQARNTVGCGDVLLGVFLARWLEADEPGQALAAAVAAAAASAEHPVTAHFDPRRYERLRQAMGTIENAR